MNSTQGLLLLAALAVLTVFSGAVLLASLAQGRNPSHRAATVHGLLALALQGLGFVLASGAGAIQRALPTLAVLAAGAGLGVRLYLHHHRRDKPLPQRAVLAHVGVALAGLMLLFVPALS